ncbi:MAG TPA: hypothetical protein VKQ11_14645 [Candidatus Sulfotelmatobacter sp.]|nr:hypothetical protein [Candidatus Sulfotelmatobacter sp.]
MACNSLRIDPGDGAPVLDYRIENGHVESRISFSPEENIQSDWQAISPEELSEHVMSGTILSLWLRRRMGIFRLVRACSLDASSTNYTDAPTLLMEKDRKPLVSENT